MSGPRRREERLEVRLSTTAKNTLQQAASLQRKSNAADILGARARLVRAIDKEAKTFYEHFDFEPSPTDPLHLFLLMKDIRAAIPGD
jgi:uncharacterized protein (DUF1778 family)